MSGARFETLRWTRDALELIDQRVLPGRIEYVRCRTASEVACAICDMVVRGAPAIGCAAAYGMALAARDAGQACDHPALRLRSAHDELLASRPTAVNLAWALARMRALWAAETGDPAADLADRLLAEARAIHAEDLAANHALGAHGAALLPDACRVLTHCNAGALATAGHGTALGVIRSAAAAGKRVAVLADETRPVLQGARLTAWELQQEGIPVTVIADGAAGYLMSRGEVDVVIVGADRVAANGDVANKIGTYMVAVVARRHAIPFYVACPTSTIDASIASGADIVVEERSPSEVHGFGAERWTPAGTAARNPAFDITPAELVSALVTERGIVRAPYGSALAALLCADGGSSGARW